MRVIVPKLEVARVDYDGDYFGDRVVVWVDRKRKTPLFETLEEMITARRNGVGIATPPTFFNAEGKVC